MVPEPAASCAAQLLGQLQQGQHGAAQQQAQVAAHVRYERVQRVGLALGEPLQTGGKPQPEQRRGAARQLRLQQQLLRLPQPE